LSAAQFATMNFDWHRGRPGAALLVAHRGASDVAPENTLPAIARAVDAGVDAIEIDVQRTADGVLVLVHDASWRRTTGVDVDVRALAWTRVRTLDAGAWFGANYRGVKPPRLDDVLEVVKGRVALNIEIKSPEHDAGLADAVVAAVRAHGMQGHVLLTSCDHGCIDALARGVEDIALGYVADQPVERGHERVRVYAYEARMLAANQDALPSAHGQGCAVLAWTVDDERDARRLLRAGVDAIVTNKPVFLAPIVRSEA
jgi:glycerophosphoryl diester phosphodiesterase